MIFEMANMSTTRFEEAISENNINKAFFNMNAQISAVLLLMFALSTLING